jgi:hypothetical protein
MAFTFSKLASVTVGSGGAATISFKDIPQNYKDLCIKVSARSGRTSFPDDGLLIALNGSTSSFTQKGIEGSGSSASSFTAGWASTNSISNINGPTSTANTFSNNEIYIPNYTSNNFKSLFSDSVQENNQTVAYIDMYASFWSNVTAITSITFTTYSTTNFTQYSTVTLYGVRAEI